MRELRFYKPNKDGNGSATKLNFREQKYENDGKSYTELLLFWTMAPQNGKDENENAKFFWNTEREVKIKLGDADVGELLAVLNGKKEKAGTTMGLFHKNDNGSTSMTFQKNEYGYYTRLAFQNKEKRVTEVKSSITLGEAEILRLFLERYILKKYW